MELTEPIPSINSQLVELFGIDTISGLPMWRVVYSNDQLEKRLGTYDDYTEGGIYLRTVREVREVPKYRQWIPDKYVLERLTIIPDINKEDLPTSRMSYEPMYVFEDSHGKYLPPKLNACKFAIDTVYAAEGKHSLAKYVEPEGENENRVAKLQEELFGNETSVGDALAHGYGVTVPNQYGES